MKNLLAFAMVVSLGLFCAVGCQPAKSDKPADKPAATSATDTETKAAPKAEGEAAKAAPAEEKKK
ncbi:MAG: hypothetical protein ABFC77_00560 [Thermoguttaceae bacterium]